MAKDYGVNTVCYRKVHVLKRRIFLIELSTVITGTLPQSPLCAIQIINYLTEDKANIQRNPKPKWQKPL